MFEEWGLSVKINAAKPNENFSTDFNKKDVQ